MTDRQSIDISGSNQLSAEDKKRLDDLGGQILRAAELDFPDSKNYDWIRTATDDVGYADFYLSRSWNDSKMINEADATIYHQLLNLDTVLGTTASENLCCCLCWTTRWDIIQVKV